MVTCRRIWGASASLVASRKRTGSGIQVVKLGKKKGDKQLPIFLRNFLRTRRRTGLPWVAPKSVER